MSQEKYIGMDVHQATISVAVMDAQGKLIMECLLETKAATIVGFIQGLAGGPAFGLFSFPQLKLWVPRPCVLCKGGYDAAGTGCVRSLEWVSHYRPSAGCAKG
jgi:hypothetical protein